MAIKKSALYVSFWAFCEKLRSGMDASYYNDYVLFLLFIRYLSDKYVDSNDFAPPLIIMWCARFKDILCNTMMIIMLNVDEQEAFYPILAEKDVRRRMAYGESFFQIVAKILDQDRANWREQDRNKRHIRPVIRLWDLNV